MCFDRLQLDPSNASPTGRLHVNMSVRSTGTPTGIPEMSKSAVRGELNDSSTQASSRPSPDASGSTSPLESINVTTDGGVVKEIVREGPGDVPPLHARCLGAQSILICS